MLWLYATVAAAIIWGILSLVSKKLMENSSSLVFTTIYSVLATIFYIPVFLYTFVGSQLEFSLVAVAATLISGAANIASSLIYNLSIKIGEVSKVVPFTRLSPIFTAILGFFILNEHVGLKLSIGIIAATFGSYIVIKEKNKSLISILQSKENFKPVGLATLSALMVTIAALADRTATQQIQPEMYTFFVYMFMSTGLLSYHVTKKPENLDIMREKLSENTGLYIFTGLTAALASLLIFTAYSKAPASKVMPIINLQVLISVITGGILFKEGNLLRKTAGSIILVAGVSLVAI